MKIALMAAALLFAACKSDSLQLQDCQASLEVAKGKAKVNANFSEDVCPNGSASFVAAYVKEADAGIQDFAGALRADRFMFASLLADRCAGAGLGSAVRECILREAAKVQVGCASAVAGCTEGKAR